MCNDYERQIDWEAFKAATEAAHLGLRTSTGRDSLPPAQDVRVNDIAPVLVQSANATDLLPMRWGFAPARAGGPRVFNFKSEGRDFTKSRRCLIPASAFFEFTGKNSPKTKWRFELAGDPVFAVAGLWREGSGGSAFTMLTTSPGPDVEPFHDRQIVVLPRQRWGEWLYLSQESNHLLAPLPGGSLKVMMARPGKEAPDERLLNLTSAKEP